MMTHPTIVGGRERVRLDMLASAKAGDYPAKLSPQASTDKPVQHYIRPSARDRWMASNLHFYKPRIVENIIRSAISGNLIAQWLMFDLMEQTWPRLVKNLNELKDAAIDLIRQSTLRPFARKGDKPSAEAQRRAKLIDQVVWYMRPDPTINENDFDDTLRDMMDAIGKGISVVETDWVYDQGFWQPRATRWVHPRFYGYPPYGITGDTADRLMLNAHEVMLANPDIKLPGLWAPFPPDNFIISIFKQKTGHPLTGSLLRILGFFWAAQNFTWEWFINLAQIFGAPIRWATYDPTREELLGLISEMLQRMGSSGWAALPEGTKLELKEGVQNAKDNPQKVLIDMADTLCDILILGQTLTTSQGERGSQSLGAIHKDVRDEKIHATAGRVLKTINQQFIPAVCRLNFGDDNECPCLEIPQEEEDSAIERAQRDDIVMRKVPVSKQWYYARHGIPEPEPGEDVIEPNPNGAVGANDDDPNAPNPTGATARAKGVDSLDHLTNNVMEGLTGVQAKWLAGIKPFFRELIAAAKSGEVSDEKFVETLRKASRQFPELFSRLDTTHLAQAMEKAMGAAAVNGAVAGMMNRRVK